MYLNVCGPRVVEVGRSGVDVSHVRWGIGGGPSAVLLQDILVGFGVKVCPPHQHLGESRDQHNFYDPSSLDFLLQKV